MVLKVLHPYLDECKIAFVAVANKSFDAANANRMLCVYRSLPSQADQLVLACGCLGLQSDHVLSAPRNNLNAIVTGLCEGYRSLSMDSRIPKIFHDRDFIYMLRQLRWNLSTNSTKDDASAAIRTIKPLSLLKALEDNFNGITTSEFQILVNIFFESVQRKLPSYRLPEQTSQQSFYRDVPAILYESLRLDSEQRRLYGRYKLLIDESEDESAINLLFQTHILDSDIHQTMVFRMSDFSDDANNDLKHVEILSNIKLCMETGKTIVMVNTNRVHGSLYDVFNQNFSIMATGDTRKIFSKVAIGSKTMDVVVHENFQCLVHVKRSEMVDLPAPFLSRFQKFSLNINDFYQIQAAKLSKNEKDILDYVETKVTSFIDHIGKQYFYGLNNTTLSSYLISLIIKDPNGEFRLSSIDNLYTQWTINHKALIEENPSDVKQCFCRLVLNKLVQLLSPESIVVALPTFEENFQRWLSKLYFQQQDHFNVEHFLQKLVPIVADRDDLDSNAPRENTRKVMIFTRTSPYVLELGQHLKQVYLNDNGYIDKRTYLDRGKIEVLSLVSQ